QRHRRARPRRAGAWPGGAADAVGDAEVGERTDAELRAAEPGGLVELHSGARAPLLRALSGLPGRTLLFDLERAEPEPVPPAAVRRQEGRESRDLREALPRRVRPDQGGDPDGAG